MTDTAVQVREFGSTPMEKQTTLLTIGAEMRAAEKVDPQKWRTQLATEVARQCGQNDQRVYTFIGTLGAEKLKKVRIACIGEVAEKDFYESVRRGRYKKPAQTTPTVDAEKQRWKSKFSEAISAIKSDKTPMTKTAIVRLAMGQESFDYVYRVIGRFTTAELEGIGFPKPGDYTPEKTGDGTPIAEMRERARVAGLQSRRNPTSNGHDSAINGATASPARYIEAGTKPKPLASPNGAVLRAAAMRKGVTRHPPKTGQPESLWYTEEAEASRKNAALHLESARARFRSQIESLPVGKRTRRELGTLRNAPPWKVNIFLTNNPDLAALLDD